MQTTSHYYNVTICSFICETLSYPCTNGSSLMSISISSLSAATEYFIYVSAVVIRIEHGTSRKWILQDDPTMLKAKTGGKNFKGNNTMLMQICSTQTIKSTVPCKVLMRLEHFATLQSNISVQMFDCLMFDRKIILQQWPNNATIVCVLKQHNYFKILFLLWKMCLVVG